MALSPEALATVEAAEETIRAADVVRTYPETIAPMSDEDLETTCSAQILASEALFKAMTDQHAIYQGSSIMVLMPGETIPRFLTIESLTSVQGEHAAAAAALAAYPSLEEGQTLVIAQGWNCQMVQFTYTWSS